MERKLRYLEKEIKKDGIPMLDTGENPEAPQPREMIDLEVRIYIFYLIVNIVPSGIFEKHEYRYLIFQLSNLFIFI